MVLVEALLAEERLYGKQTADGIPHAFGNGQEALGVEC